MEILYHLNLHRQTVGSDSDKLSLGVLLLNGYHQREDLERGLCYSASIMPTGQTKDSEYMREHNP